MSQDEARRRFQAGELSESARYRRPGMVGWNSLAKLFAPVGPKVVARGTMGESYFFRREEKAYVLKGDPRVAAGVAIGLLAVYIGCAIYAMRAYLGRIDLLGGVFTKPEAVASDTAVGLATFAGLGAYVVAAIGYCVWLYQVSENCQGLRAGRMRFSPGWAVGWYFVPIMSLFRPFQVMVEIWKVSADPRNWREQGMPWLVGVWWFLFVASSLVMTAVGFGAHEGAESGPVAAEAWGMIAAYLLRAVSAVAAMALIGSITVMQVRLVRGAAGAAGDGGSDG